MAEKRMLSNKIISSDAFSNLSLSAQALYLHLNMNADDDGIVDSPHRTQRAIGAADEAFQELIEKRFILIVDGVTVIKHWHINNNIRSDKKAKSAYPEIVAKLKIKENGAYTLADESRTVDNQIATTCQPNDSQTAGNRQPIGSTLADDEQPNDSKKAVQNSIVKNSILNDSKKAVQNSIVKNSIVKNSLKKPYDHRSDDHAPEEPEIVTTIEKRFEEFWSLYPRKVGKLKAFQSFKKINPNKQLFDTMMEALRENIASNAQWKRDNGQYIPHPTTWLNQGRWFDEISTDAPGAAEDFFTRALKGEVDY